ncbi:hypothetical protein EJ04DRAFT_465589, partial [Polyplosphaeria fusca]
MESSPAAMIKFLIPKIPFMTKTALLHTLSFSETSSKWDLRTELTVKVLRQVLGPNGTPSTVTKQQRLTTKDPGVKGKVWVCKVTCPVDEGDGVRQTLFKCIQEMGDGTEKFTPPASQPLEAEWNGYRADATDTTPEPVGLTEQEKYDKLVSETTSKVTVLYFHGGAMYLLDPATYRLITSRIARETGGRVFSIRYRLSPQHPFPSALLDALTSYLTLLHPPPGSPHPPIPASQIIFGGDSAGGLLCASLLQLLLHLHRSSITAPPTVPFHGEIVDVPMPGGVALSSPWLDVTRSLPSVEGLAKYDYLPPPSLTARKTYPACEAWPTSPPRADMYCEGPAYCHPLVSPLAAKDWTGAPPVFFGLGQEMLRDEDAVLAGRIAGQGGVVWYREFESMPHCFGFMLTFHRACGVYWGEYGGFCVRAVEGGEMGEEGEREGVESGAGAVVFEAKTLERRVVDIEGLSRLTEGEVDDLMSKGMERLERSVGAG